MNEGFIDIDRVCMHFGATEAVREVTFAVPRGSIFGLVGSDGAGKSTLLRMVATMIPPAAGREQVSEREHHRIAFGAGIALLHGARAGATGSRRGGTV